MVVHLGTWTNVLGLMETTGSWKVLALLYANRNRISAAVRYRVEVAVSVSRLALHKLSQKRSRLSILGWWEPIVCVAPTEFCHHGGKKAVVKCK